MGSSFKFTMALMFASLAFSISPWFAAASLAWTAWAVLGLFTARKEDDE